MYLGAIMEGFFEQPIEQTERMDEMTSAEEIHVCGRDCDCCDNRFDPSACSNVFYQTDLVSVPVKVVPFAKAGPCTTVCCGSPVITAGDTCQGEIDQVCEFTITQKLCIKLPLHFGAAVKVDHAKVQCGSVSETECDCKNPCIRKCD